jgi:hypothetical protein
LFHGFDTLGSHLREEGSLDYDGGLFLLQVQTNFDTIINCQHLVHPEETMLQTVPIHEDCVVVEVLTVYTIFADELLEYPPNDEMMKLGQAEGQKL